MLGHMLESPYGSFRKGQLESIGFIRSNLGSFIALRAPTGFGKTLVAVLSHIGTGRVLYAVRTRNEIAPVIRELRAVGVPFTIVFSGRRMCPLTKVYEVPPEDFWFNCKILRLRGLCTYFNSLGTRSSSSVLRLLKDYDEVDPGALVRTIADRFYLCPFFVLAGLVSEVDFVVATYPYLFRDDVYSTAFTDVSLSEFYVVVDEAHNLLNPQAVISASIDLRTVKLAYEVVVSLGYEDVAEYLRGLIRVIDGLRNDRLKRIDKGGILAKGMADKLSSILLELKLRVLSRLGSRPEAVMGTTSPLSRLTRFLYILDRGFINVYGLVRGDKELHALPVSYEAVLERLRVAKGVLMMSGTLPGKELINLVTGRDVKYLDVARVFGPVFPKSSAYYVVYTALTTSYSRRSGRMFMEYARLVRAVYEVSDGVVLAVYPSYEVLSDVAGYLAGVERVVNEGAGTTLGEVLSAIASGERLLVNAVAGGKLVEGIELRSSSGRSLIGAVVVCGVPYPQPDDYLSDFRNALAPHLGEKVARKVVLDVQAGIKVMQAIGRAVRSESDRVFAVLADRRFLSSSLRESLGIDYDYVTSSLEGVVARLKRFRGDSSETLYERSEG